MRQVSYGNGSFFYHYSTVFLLKKTVNGCVYLFQNHAGIMNMWTVDKPFQSY